MSAFECLAGNKSLFWLMYLHLTAQRGTVRPEDVEFALSLMLESEEVVNPITLLDHLLSDDDKNLVWMTGQTYINTTKDVVAQAEAMLTDLE